VSQKSFSVQKSWQVPEGEQLLFKLQSALVRQPAMQVWLAALQMDSKGH
jgi:hypothetical protein